MTLPCLPDHFSDEALSRDAFLGGALVIAQPLKGYRAGVDPVLLAASVDARPGQRVLELGCGGGVASLCLARRVDGLALTGVELQAPYAALAERNAADNSVDLEVICADLADLPDELRQRQFDHVIANPPYYDRARSTAAQDSGREAGLGETTALDVWVKIAAKRLAPAGYASFVQRADRLPDLLCAVSKYLGSVEVQPLQPRQGRNAHLVIVRGKKSGRADFRLHAPIVMHDGRVHQEKSKDYNAVIEAVLREGAALPFGGQA